MPPWRKLGSIGYTPLTIAVDTSNVKMFRMLLDEFDADPNIACSYYAFTPIFSLSGFDYRDGNNNALNWMSLLLFIDDKDKSRAEYFIDEIVKILIEHEAWSRSL